MLTPIGNCLRHPSGKLAQIVAGAQRLKSVNRVLAVYLPEHVRAHARITSLNSHQWLVVADSAAWATRLRYILPQVQQQLSEHFGYAIPVLKVRVRPQQDAPTSDTGRRLRITEQASRSLLSAAAEIKDQQLSDALRKLASYR